MSKILRFFTGPFNGLVAFFHKKYASTPVDEAFAKVSPSSCYLGEYEKAALVLDNFSIPMLGEECAFKFLVHTINSVYFPRTITREYIGRAERFLEELLGLSGDHELHMDEVAAIGQMMREGRTFPEISQIYKKIPA